MPPTFFTSQSQFHTWLEKNHDKANELLIGFYKTTSKKPGKTYKEALDVALCFGWIDGVRKGMDKERYTIRFTPRRKGSIWSQVNIKRHCELVKLDLMQPAGLKVFQERDPKKEKLYLHEQEKTFTLDVAQEKKFRANKKAWKFFSLQAPSYRKVAIWWVVKAKQEATRLRRLEQLINISEKGKRLN